LSNGVHVSFHFNIIGICWFQQDVVWLKDFHCGLHCSVLDDMVLKPASAYNINPYPANVENMVSS